MKLIFPDSQLAHKYLDHLIGVEIGGAKHNPFNLPNCMNVDYTDDMNTVFKINEVQLCGEAMPVDIIANGDALPFDDATIDYVISSHVIEHFFDPIKAIQEWLRVIKPGGYIFIICPHKDRIFDANRDSTSVDELIKRHDGTITIQTIDVSTWHNSSTVSGLSFGDHGHWCAWTPEAFKQLCDYMELKIIEYLDVDDKVGNGFLFVIQK